MKRDERPSRVDDDRPRLVWPSKPARGTRALPAAAPLVVTEHHGAPRADGGARNRLIRADNRAAIPALLGELSAAAADALDRAPRDLPASLGIVILPPRSKRPDVDAVLRATRGVAGRASGAKPPVVVEVYVPTDSA